MENTTTANNHSYSSHPDSRDSSPRSREMIDKDTTNNDNHHSSFDDPPPPSAACKVKLMCSYGGKIQPRPHDNHLTYVAGDTKILAVDRHIKLPAFVAKLTSLTGGSAEFCLKYQLPGEDLDALVSVTNDEDLDYMMLEYDRLSRSSPRPARLRLFLFSLNNSNNNTSSFSYSSSGPPTEPKPQWFVEALNSVQAQAPNLEASPPPAPLPPPSANPDFLFGLDNAYPLGPKQADLPDIAAKDPAAGSECGSEAVREPEIQDRSNSEQLVQRKNDEVAPSITHATAQVHSGPVQFPGPVQGNGYPLVLSAAGTDPGPVYLIQTPSGMYQAVRPVTGPAGQPVYFIQTPQPAHNIAYSNNGSEVGSVSERGYSQMAYMPDGSALRRQATAAPGSDVWN